MLDPVFSSLIALSGALLFGSAVVVKLRSPANFVATLAEYRLLPLASVAIVGGFIGAIEFAVAAGFLWPAARSISATVAAMLLMLYAGAIGINLARGRRDLDCGCGLEPRPIGSWMILRNVLLAAALLLLRIPASGRALGLADFMTIAGGLIVVALLYVSADVLLARPAPRQLFSMEPP